MIRTLSGVALALALSLFATPFMAHAAGMPGTMGATGGKVTVPVTAGSYRLTLVIGPMEPMYTMAQYQRTHPKTGEIMLRGAMVMGKAGMGMGMPNRHLELHVLNLRTMRVVTDAMVSITYQPVAPMGAMAMRPQNVPPTLMVGIGKGMSDAHFGNNVYMPRGEYRIVAHVNNAHATYDVRLM